MGQIFFENSKWDEDTYFMNVRTNEVFTKYGTRNVTLDDLVDSKEVDFFNLLNTKMKKESGKPYVLGDNYIISVDVPLYKSDFYEYRNTIKDKDIASIILLDSYNISCLSVKTDKKRYIYTSEKIHILDTRLHEMNIADIDFRPNLQVIDSYNFSTVSESKTLDLSKLNLLKIREKAFFKNTYLEKIILPRKTEEGMILSSWVFQGCEKLKYVFLPDNTVAIGDCCFSNCNSLEKIYIPSTLLNTVYANTPSRNIPKYIFKGLNPNIKEILFDTDNEILKRCIKRRLKECDKDFKYLKFVKSKNCPISK